MRYQPGYASRFFAPFGRQSGLSLIVSFNESDWTSGWTHLLKGATLFLTPEYETTLDPDDSIALNPNEIPLVTFRKRIRFKTKQIETKQNSF